MSGSETRKRQKTIGVRVLPSEEKSMRVYAKKNGFKTIPKYLRWLHNVERNRDIQIARARADN